MKKELALTGLLCLALSGCAGANAPKAAPTVTETVTVTETATATVTATVTAAAAAPAAAAAVPAAPAAPAETALIPAAVEGMNAQALDDDLEALGFENIIYNADTGKTVLLLRNWTVTGIDNPGAKQPLSKAVVVHVTK
ncbi:hypothetical protein [Arthrobacter sp. 131MFCol6.1]|uniref:hypothetical protein n=1 Tax=Arthrobacter sp. 131MFCol6.1 TaxID=1157944 RepID=UPI001E4A81D3|nr:hypothetical protein [Arthrobacter sp. 131MFCol6.1]